MKAHLKLVSQSPPSITALTTMKAQGGLKAKGKTLLQVERAEYILHEVLVVERAEIYHLLEHRIIVRRSMYVAYMFSPWRLLPFFHLSKVANGIFSFTKMR